MLIRYTAYEKKVHTYVCKKQSGKMAIKINFYRNACQVTWH